MNLSNKYIKILLRSLLIIPLYFLIVFFPVLLKQVKATVLTSIDRVIVTESSTIVPIDYGAQSSVISPDGRYIAFQSYATNILDVSSLGGAPTYGRIFLYDTQTDQTRLVPAGSSPATVNLGDISSEFVVFASNGTGLVAGDTNGKSDIFLYNIETGVTTRVSVDSDGVQGNNNSSSYTSISSDGRYVAFSSSATNLIAGGTTGTQLFLHDNQTGETTLASVDSDGVQGNGTSGSPILNSDGRYVTFQSSSTNLVTGDTNSIDDVFLHDNQTGITTRVSVTSEGVQANHLSVPDGISSDGRYIIFDSNSSLVSGPDIAVDDVFLHDNQTGETTMVSVDSAGNQQNSSTAYRSSTISSDGKYIAFYSGATNLVPDDTNGAGDVFLHNIETGETTLVSVDESGNQFTQGRASYVQPGGFSSDDRYVLFTSDSGTNIGEEDDPEYIDEVWLYDSQTGVSTKISKGVLNLGGEGNSESFTPSISSDGRYITFSSVATNLVSDDTNDTSDVFLQDTQTGDVTRVSVDSEGNEGNDESGDDTPKISSDGRYIVFSSLATNLIADGTDGYGDVLLHDNQTGETTLVSVDSEGNHADNYSSDPSISADGRYVVFQSYADNLVADGSGISSIFLHDNQTGETTLVSADSNGTPGDDESYHPSISADGRYTTFDSYADNLVADDTGGNDIFLHDNQTGETTLISVDSNGVQNGGDSYNPSISADGRYVTFYSNTSSLVPDDDAAVPEIFFHDNQTGETTRVSVDSEGNDPDNDSYNSSISADGRYVVFDSYADNLVPDDTNGSSDIFLHDTQTGETKRISVNENGDEADDESTFPNITDDGQYVVFQSVADNLVDDDTNGSSDIFYVKLANVSLSYSGSFTESSSNNGTLDGSRVIDITNDTFTHHGDTLEDGVDYTLTNLPTGLTPVMSVNAGGNRATLTLTGQATSHANTNDVTNLTITFNNSAFTLETNASSVTNYTDPNGIIDFHDPESNHGGTTGGGGGGGGSSTTPPPTPVPPPTPTNFGFTSTSGNTSNALTCGGTTSMPLLVTDNLDYIWAHWQNTPNTVFGISTYGPDGKQFHNSSPIKPTPYRFYGFGSEGDGVYKIVVYAKDKVSGLVSPKATCLLTYLKEPPIVVVPPPIIEVPEPPTASSTEDTTSSTPPTFPPGGLGCLDEKASNYNSLALTDDGSCIYSNEGGSNSSKSLSESISDIIKDPSKIPSLIKDSLNLILDNLSDFISNIFKSLTSSAIFNNPVIKKAVTTIKDYSESLPGQPIADVAVLSLAVSSLFLALLQPNIVSLPFRLFNLLPVLLGLKRKERPWGTVYDSVTKQPLDPAYVSLKDNTDKDVSTSITDIDGRYGFLASLGSYHMQANKTNYVFPSKKMMGKDHDELYDNLYFGGSLNVTKQDDIIYKNIPMDSLNFNWNEFQKTKNKKLMRFYSKRDLFFSHIASTLFIAGLISSIALFFASYSALNVIVLSVYILIIILRIFGLKPKQGGYVRDTYGYPLSFGLIRLYSSSLNQEVAHTIIGKTGKYYLLVANGDYYMKVYKKTGEDTYEQFYESPEFKVKGGCVRRVVG